MFFFSTLNFTFVICYLLFTLKNKYVWKRGKAVVKAAALRGKTCKQNLQALFAQQRKKTCKPLHSARKTCELCYAQENLQAPDSYPVASLYGLWLRASNCLSIFLCENKYMWWLGTSLLQALLCTGKRGSRCIAREKLVSSVMRGKIKRCREAWEKALYSSSLLFLFFIILTRKIKLKNVSRRFDVVKRVQVWIN